MSQHARPQAFVSVIVWAMVWLVVCAGAPLAHAQESLLEYAVKATYLYKFAPFVDWPSANVEFPNGDFTICVVGDDPVNTLLDRAVHGQDIAGHPIAIRRYAGTTADPACPMMYVASADAHSAASILAAVRGTPVLTVTDSASDPAVRGIINFITSDGHVRFEIDSSAAAANGLVISSKLLNLAVRKQDRR